MNRLLASLIGLWLLLAPGCASRPEPTADRAQAAQALFDRVTKEYHLPSGEAREPEKARLLAKAAAGYESLLRQFPGQTHCCAQALRSLGNVRAAQGNLDAAVKAFARLEGRYPAEEWEILQAWKSAGDLLWEAGRRDEAGRFYRKLVERFDNPQAPAVVKMAVKGARSRLNEIR